MKGTQRRSCFLDFRTAHVSHKILIEKLIQKDLGRGKHRTGMENWLQDCKQMIMINGTVLSWGEVILNKFINDLERGLKSTPTKSDDCIKARLCLTGARLLEGEGDMSSTRILLPDPWQAGLACSSTAACHHRPPSAAHLLPCCPPQSQEHFLLPKSQTRCVAATQPLAHVRNAGVHWQEEGWDLPVQHSQEKKTPPLKITQTPYIPPSCVFMVSLI